MSDDLIGKFEGKHIDLVSNEWLELLNAKKACMLTELGSTARREGMDSPKLIELHAYIDLLDKLIAIE